MVHLLEVGESTRSDLSRLVAAWENGIQPNEVTSVQRKRVYTALHQTHLPRLDECGVVSYDCDRGTTAATDRLDVFEPYLHQSDDDRRTWHHYYAIVGVGAIGLGGASLAGVPGVTDFVTGLVVLVGAVILGISTKSARSRGDDTSSRDGDGRSPFSVPSET